MSKLYASVPDMVRDLSADKDSGEKLAKAIERRSAKTHWWKCQGVRERVPAKDAGHATKVLKLLEKARAV